MKQFSVLFACAALLCPPLAVNANTAQAPTPQQRFENGISSQKRLQQSMQQSQKLQQQQLNQQLQQRSQQLQQQRQQQLQQDLQRSQQTTTPPQIQKNP